MTRDETSLMFVLSILGREMRLICGASITLCHREPKFQLFALEPNVSRTFSLRRRLGNLIRKESDVLVTQQFHALVV